MTMPTSDKKVTIRVRDRTRLNPWGVDNFHQLGWKVRNAENSEWIVMGPENTRIRNPEHDTTAHDADDADYPLWLEPLPVEDAE